MKRLNLLLTIVLFGQIAVAQRASQAQPQTQKATSSAAPAGNPAAGTNLEGVLSQMDAAAEHFRSVRADFAWDQYQKVVDETDTQTGSIYFKRTGRGTQMAADITVPDRKYVVFKDDTLELYQPSIDQLTEYSTGGHSAEVDAFVVLGFGGRGHDLLRSFEVRYLGNVVINGVQTAELELIPKQPKVRGMFSRILIWVDPARAVSLQQQFFEPSGDYRLAHYNNIRVNAKISEGVFRIRTTPRTNIVRPQS